MLLAAFLFQISTVTVPGVLPLSQLKVAEFGVQLVAVRNGPPMPTWTCPGVGPNPPPVTVNDLVVLIETDDGLTPVTVGCSRVTAGVVQEGVYP